MVLKNNAIISNILITKELTMKNSLSQIPAKLLFLFSLMCVCIACKEKKQAIRTFSSQWAKNTPQYFLDSAMFVLNQNKSLKDTSYHCNITHVNIVSQDYDTFAFIGIHSEAIENDSIFYPNSLYIAQFQIDKWILKDSTLLDDMALYVPDKILKEDVNFDNQKDIILTYMIQSASRGIYLHKLFITKPKANYQLVSLYSSDPDLNISKQNKTIMIGEDGGIYGLNSKSVYHWNSDTLQEIKRLDKIVILDKQGNMIGDETTEYHLENNELVVKKELKDGVDYFDIWEEID